MGRPRPPALVPASRARSRSVRPSAHWQSSSRTSAGPARASPEGVEQGAQGVDAAGLAVGLGAEVGGAGLAQDGGQLGQGGDHRLGPVAQPARRRVGQRRASSGGGRRCPRPRPRAAGTGAGRPGRRPGPAGPSAARLRLLGQLVEQPGLAAARLGLQQHQAAPALGRPAGRAGPASASSSARPTNAGSVRAWRRSWSPITTAGSADARGAAPSAMAARSARTAAGRLVALGRGPCAAGAG